MADHLAKVIDGVVAGIYVCPDGHKEGGLIPAGDNCEVGGAYKDGVFTKKLPTLPLVSAEVVYKELVARELNKLVLANTGHSLDSLKTKSETELLLIKE